MRCDDERRSKPIHIEGHGRPVTRRDFLGRGLIGGAAMVMSPSLLGLFGRAPEARAQAASCGVGTGSGGRIPFLCFDLAGGASIPGSNVLVGGPGGQLDFLSPEGYLKLGLPADMTPMQPGQINQDLGLAFHADSAFLRGILARTTPETLAKVNGTLFCTRSDNDTQNNPHNPMYGINRAGADGSLLTLIGTQSSESGGRSIAPASLLDPAVRPTKVDRASDATGLVDTGKLVDLLDAADASVVMAAAEALSRKKIEKMQEDALVEQVFGCAYTETTELVANFGNPDLLDPRLDADIVGPIFSLDEVENASAFRKTAAVMKLVVNGYAGAGTVEFGGYDYHNSTRATGERKDFEAGQAMGAALEYAARVGSPLVLYVFSDGSVASDGVLDNSAEGRGKGIWKGDNSSTAGTFMLVYDPNATLERPRLRSATSSQIGWFRASGSVETAATRVSNEVENLVQAVVLNYLALHGDEGMLNAIIPDHNLGDAGERDALIAFEPIV